MPKLVINGGNELNGTVSIHGSKNSVLPILCACVLCKDNCVIHNCPKLSDVFVTVKILEHLGCRCEWDKNTLSVDSSKITNNFIPKELMCKMRSSIVFLSSITARAGKAKVYNPGGCNLGPRPVDLHIFALRALGVKINEENGTIFADTQNNLTGNVIKLPKISVGATETAIIAAACAKGKTVIINAAKEPEVTELCMFLNKAGAKISGGGNSIITINGVGELSGAEYTVMPDRIVASTVLCGVAACGGNAEVQNVNAQQILPLIKVLRNCGCTVNIKNSALDIKAPKMLYGGKRIITDVYPGFPTDAGPLIVASLATARGKSMLKETVFENRFEYVNMLNRMGADITVKNGTAHINGVKKLYGANVFAADLRGGAALVIAALCAEGNTVIDNISFIDRGYEKIENLFSSLAGDIKRIN